MMFLRKRRSVVANVSDSIVTIEVYAGGQAYSTGSGVVYQKEDNTLYIVTIIM